jgi:hypothetical protein
MKQRINALNVYLRGWFHYFKLARTHTVYASVLYEPPYAGRHVRWCAREAALKGRPLLDFGATSSRIPRVHAYR